MNLQIYFVRSKEIIQFCHTSVMENFGDPTDFEELPEPSLEQLPPAASIDIYATYMFVIAILLGFVYFKRLNIKK